MDDILKADDEARLVVVEGAPGIGKSTLAWELCRQWPLLESLKRFSLVVLLRLREESVQSAKDINGLFPCGDDPDLSSRVVQKVKEDHGNRVLFVFDGFDEFPLRLRNSLDSSVIMNIIAGNLLPKATVLLTSRPSATAGLQSNFQKAISKHIEIVGFSGAEIQEYANSIFGKTPETLDSFNTYLSANPVVKGMMYNPLNCSIIVGVYQDTYESGRPVPHTQTQLYTELTLCLLTRYLSATGDPLAGKLPDKLEGLPHDSDLYQQLVKVGKFAFNGKQREEVIFKELPEGCSDLGLLVKHTALYTRSETTTYNFFHLTMQEYMSAFYISQLPVNEQKFYCSERQYSMGTWDVIWRFVAGLTKMQKVGWDKFAYGENDFEEYRVSSLLLECLYEAQDVQSCENIFSQTTAPVFPIESLTGYSNYELYALGYCISVCSNIMNVKIEHITQDGLEMLGHGIRSVDYHDGGSLEELDLSSSEEAMNERKNLLHIPFHILKHIKTLTLMYCSIDQRGFENLAECVPYLHSLTLLNISQNRGGEESLVKLFQALKKHNKLLKLYMNSIKEIGMTDVEALADLIQPPSSMRVLSVSSISFESYERLSSHKPSAADARKQLVVTVLSPSSLNTVFMLDSRYPLDFIETISANISNLYLHYLDMNPFRPTDNSSSGTKLSRLVRENTSLKELVLYIPLEKDVVHDIIDSLKDNHSLEMLGLVVDYHLQYFSEQQTLDLRVIFKP